MTGTSPKNYCFRCLQEGRKTEIPFGQSGCQRCSDANLAESKRINDELNKLDKITGDGLSKIRSAKKKEEFLHKRSGVRIAFLHRQLSIRKKVAQTGVPRLVTVKDPGPRRGLNPKNIQRVLLSGRRKLKKAVADGVDLTVLPANSRIRKRAEAVTARVLKLLERGHTVSSRGQVGRKAALDAKAKKKLAKKERAIELLRQGHTAGTVSKMLKVTERTVRRYKNDP